MHYQFVWLWWTKRQSEHFKAMGILLIFNIILHLLHHGTFLKFGSIESAVFQVLLGIIEAKNFDLFYLQQFGMIPMISSTACSAWSIPEGVFLKIVIEGVFFYLENRRTKRSAAVATPKFPRRNVLSHPIILSRPISSHGDRSWVKIINYLQ